MMENRAKRFGAIAGSRHRGRRQDGAPGGRARRKASSVVAVAGTGDIEDNESLAQFTDASVADRTSSGLSRTGVKPSDLLIQGQRLSLPCLDVRPPSTEVLARIDDALRLANRGSVAVSGPRKRPRAIFDRGKLMSAAPHRLTKGDISLERNAQNRQISSKSPLSICPPSSQVARNESFWEAQLLSSPSVANNSFGNSFRSGDIDFDSSTSTPQHSKSEGGRAEEDSFWLNRERDFLINTIRTPRSRFTNIYAAQASPHFEVRDHDSEVTAASDGSQISNNSPCKTQASRMRERLQACKKNQEKSRDGSVGATSSRPPSRASALEILGNPHIDVPSPFPRPPESPWYLSRRD